MAEGLECEPGLSGAGEGGADRQASGGPMAGGENPSPGVVRSVVIGLGGGGGNILRRIEASGGGGEAAELVAVDTDSRMLSSLGLEQSVTIGQTLTRGLGCGGDVALGNAAGSSDRDALRRLVANRELVFLIAALGGGVGSGIGPLMAGVASESGAVVIGLVTLPFGFEGEQRMTVARKAIGEMREYCDALILLPNDLLLPEGGDGRTALDVFAISDEWITRGVGAIQMLLYEVGWMQVDFASMRRALGGKGGRTLFAFGEGEDPATVMGNLLACPLLELEEGRTRVDTLLVHLASGPDLPMSVIQEIVTEINRIFGSEAETVVGATRIDRLGSRVAVCVIGSTDLDGRKFLNPRRAKPGLLPTDPDLIESSSLVLATVDPGEQGEFLELIEGGNRGIFGPTERNLRSGVDLDVPTFIRKGIKIMA